jgi:hypothetical protein
MAVKLLFLKYDGSSDAKLTPSWGTTHLSQYTRTDFAFNIRNEVRKMPVLDKINCLSLFT